MATTPTLIKQYKQGAPGENDQRNQPYQVNNSERLLSDIVPLKAVK